MCGEYITLMQFHFIRFTPWENGIIGFEAIQNSATLSTVQRIDQMLCDANQVYYTLTYAHLCT